MNDKRPTVGTKTKHPHTGELCTIVKVHPFGTMDIKDAKGNRYRITGLSFR